MDGDSTKYAENKSQQGLPNTGSHDRSPPRMNFTTFRGNHNRIQPNTRARRPDYIQVNPTPGMPSWLPVNRPRNYNRHGYNIESEAAVEVNLTDKPESLNTTDVKREDTRGIRDDTPFDSSDLGGAVAGLSLPEAILKLPQDPGAAPFSDPPCRTSPDARGVPPFDASALSPEMAGLSANASVQSLDMSTLSLDMAGPSPDESVQSVEMAGPSLHITNFSLDAGGSSFGASTLSYDMDGPSRDIGDLSLDMPGSSFDASIQSLQMAAPSLDASALPHHIDEQSLDASVQLLDMAGPSTEVSVQSIDMAVPSLDMAGSSPDVCVQSIDMAGPSTEVSVQSIDMAIPSLDMARSSTEVNVQSIDMSVPTLDMAAPSTEASVQSIDMAVPSLDMAGSSPDVRVQSIDMAVPSLDMAGPSTEVSVQSIDMAVPSLDMAGSSTEVSVQSIDMAVPSLDMAGPSTEVSVQSIDMAVPSLDMAGPSTEVSVQSIDMTVPSPDMAGSSTEVSVQSIDMAVPSLDMARSSTEASVQSIDMAVPSLDMAGPSTEVSVQSIDMAIPSLDMAGSSPNVCVQSIDMAVPSLDMAGPSTEVSVQSIDMAVPSLDIAGSSTEVSVQSIDMAVPSLDMAGPSTEVSVQSINMARPSLDASVLSLDMAGPTLEESALTLEMAGPSLATTIQLIDMAEPLLDTSALPHDKVAESLDASVVSLDSNALSHDMAGPSLEASKQSINMVAPILENVARSFESCTFASRLKEIQNKLQTTLDNLETESMSQYPLKDAVMRQQKMPEKTSGGSSLVNSSSINISCATGEPGAQSKSSRAYDNSENSTDVLPATVDPVAENQRGQAGATTSSGFTVEMPMVTNPLTLGPSEITLRLLQENQTLQALVLMLHRLVMQQQSELMKVQSTLRQVQESHASLAAQVNRMIVPSPDSVSYGPQLHANPNSAFPQGSLSYPWYGCRANMEASPSGITEREMRLGMITMVTALANMCAQLSSTASATQGGTPATGTSRRQLGTKTASSWTRSRSISRRRQGLKIIGTESTRAQNDDIEDEVPQCRRNMVEKLPSSDSPVKNSTTTPSTPQSPHGEVSSMWRTPMHINNLRETSAPGSEAQRMVPPPPSLGYAPRAVVADMNLPSTRKAAQITLHTRHQIHSVQQKRPDEPENVKISEAEADWYDLVTPSISLNSYEFQQPNSRAYTQRENATVFRSCTKHSDDERKPLGVRVRHVSYRPQTKFPEDIDSKRAVPQHTRPQAVSAPKLNIPTQKCALSLKRSLTQSVSTGLSTSWPQSSSNTVSNRGGTKQMSVTNTPRGHIGPKGNKMGGGKSRVKNAGWPGQQTTPQSNNSTAKKKGRRIVKPKK